MNIFVVCLNAVFGALIYYYPSLFNFSFFAFSCVAVTIVIWGFRNNFLYQLRLVLLSAIGYFAMAVKLIFPDGYFAPLSFEVQTLEVAVKMYGLTSVALAGASVGLRPISIKKSSFYSSRLHFLSKSNHIRFLMIFLLGLVGYLSAKSYGPSIFSAPYASGAGQGQLLGNLQSIGVILMVFLFISLKKQGGYSILLGYAFVVYFLLWAILIRGGRMEVVNGLLALMIAIPCFSGRIYRIKLPHILLLVCAVVFLEMWGTFRTLLAAAPGSHAGLIEGYQELFESGIVHMGTISGIAITFANVVHMVDGAVLQWFYGHSYVDYILRTPPELIYPDRPQDLAWIFPEYGYAAMGGFFELAEAYLNFGIVGCFIIPFFISFLLSVVYRTALRGEFISFFVLVALLSVFFRGAWYQSFAYYKASVTALVMAGLCFFILELVRVRKGLD